MILLPREWVWEWEANRVARRSVRLRNAETALLEKGKLEQQIREDAQELVQRLRRLQRLERSAARAADFVNGCRRGYFTPDEDAMVRRIQQHYHEHRQHLYGLIDRYISYRRISDPAVRMQAFCVGFAAAVSLYAKSLKLIRQYEHNPLVRRKLNEPEPRFQLPGGMFDEILRAHCSLRHGLLYFAAVRFWKRHFQAIKILHLPQDRDFALLVRLIRQQHHRVRAGFEDLWLRHLRRDVHACWSAVADPLVHVWDLFRNWAAHFFTLQHHAPVRDKCALNESVLEQLRPLLQPGDVLLIRAEGRLTTTLLPGFWSHAAIYLGSDLEAAAFAIPTSLRAFNRQIVDLPASGWVVDAVSPCVRIRSLADCLCADHVAIVRPLLTTGDMQRALKEALSHLGKPYDLEFDFNQAHRIVCTELIYRALHRRGQVELRLVKRLGRYTLTGDDLAAQMLEAMATGAEERTPAFQMVAMALFNRRGRVNVMLGEAARKALGRVIDR